MLNRLYWTGYLATQMRGQAHFPFRPLVEIQQAQAWRVRRMVAHAYRTVPYYRETMNKLALRPSDFRESSDLSRLPILDPAVLQRDPEYLKSDYRSTSQYVCLRTSGTSGVPRSVYHDAHSIFQNAAHGERERLVHTQRIGRRFGYRELGFYSRIGNRRRMQRFVWERAIFPPLLLQRRTVEVEAGPQRALAAMKDFRPDMIVSSGSYLEMLFPYLLDLHRSGAGFHHPKLIVWSDDSLTDAIHSHFRDDLGIPLFSAYQATEAFKIAFECDRHEGLHANIDLYPVDIVEPTGQLSAPVEYGEVVVSNLVNRATVLLNYRLGDFAKWLPRNCRCGRNLPLLSRPLGRSHEILRFGSGIVVHPFSVHGVFLNEGSIRQYQVVQRSPAQLDVALVVDSTTEGAEISGRVADKLCDLVGHDCELRVKLVDSIVQPPGAKGRTVFALDSERR